ncbi:IS1 family transposase, partial [Escherichia coli]
RYTQRIERHNLNLRQHLARLGRKSLSFSKSVELHDKGKRAARTVLTGMCYSVGSATRQGEQFADPVYRPVGYD